MEKGSTVMTDLVCMSFGEYRWTKSELEQWSFSQNDELKDAVELHEALGDGSLWCRRYKSYDPSSMVVMQAYQNPNGSFPASLHVCLVWKKKDGEYVHFYVFHNVILHHV